MWLFKTFWAALLNYERFYELRQKTFEKLYSYDTFGAQSDRILDPGTGCMTQSEFSVR